MMIRSYLSALCLAAAALLVVSAVAQERKPSVQSATTASVGNAAAATPASATHSSKASKAPQSGESDASDRIEGEKRFRTNCGRCHMPPHKFAPRVMATAIRHMRVRAMITDEDMKLILRYMTE